MKLYIKNMVCDRCVQVIEKVMQDLQLQTSSIILGEVEFSVKALSDENINCIRSAIEPLGFELVDNKSQVLVEQIKTALITLVHGEGDLENIKLSTYLSEKLNQDYHSLSHLFSSIEGLTLEKYLIHLKVERVKEWLMYDELSLTEISYRLSYSSLAHLSAQFKQVTGMTPSQFKKNKGHLQRQALDKI